MRKYLLLPAIALLFPALCCGASMVQAGEDIASEDLEQIVAVHDTRIDPFVLPKSGKRVGDPFPTYWEGVWHVYALRKDLRAIVHFTSTDLVIWNEHKPAMTGRGIATGTVVRHDNKYYMFYTDNKPQTIRLVTSDNPWHFDFSKSKLVAQADNKVYKLNKNKFRDSYVFYYNKEKLWWMLIEATSDDTVAVALFKSKDLLTWTQHDPIFKDPSRGHGSCPQLIERAGRWYLTMLDYPTWYYHADNPYDPWKLGGFYHTYRVSAVSRWATDTKRWLGWGFFTTEDTPEGDPDDDYGPLCVGRELVFNQDGSLGVRPLPELVAAIQKPQNNADLFACARKYRGTWTIDAGKQELRCTDNQGGVLLFDLPDKNPNYYIEADIRLSTPQTRADLVVRTSEAFDSGYRIAVEAEKRTASIRQFASDGGAFDKQEHVLKDGKSFHLQVFVCKGLIEAFVDGRTALSTRVVERRNHKVAIDVSGGYATITNPLLHYFTKND